MSGTSCLRNVFWSGIIVLSPNWVNSGTIESASVGAISAVAAVTGISAVLVATSIAAVVNWRWSCIVAVANGVRGGEISLLSGFLVLPSEWILLVGLEMEKLKI